MSGTASADEFFSSDRTDALEGTIDLPEGGYEDFLFDHDDPLVTRYRGLAYDTYAAERVSPSFVQELLASWQELYEEPFRGISADGEVRDGLYRLPDAASVDPAPRRAALRALELLDADQLARFCLPLDAREWRAWSNPEFVIHPVGLRLEDLTDEVADAMLALVRSCLSPEGFDRVTEVMELNGFLGRLVDLPTVMNARSYSIAMFGTPSDEEPWGWQLFGHHLAINFVAVGGRQVIAPVFLGAEPDVSIDGRPTVFGERVAMALELAGSLSPEQRAQAVVYESVLDPAMPAGRLHPADERHVAGAFRDNRVIGYEGLLASTFSAGQRDQLLSIAWDFLLLLAEPQRRATLTDIELHLAETRFSWYGPTDGSGPFYFRIQSPVVLAELDHHAGVWLTNQLPARFHIHTTLRLPNGNDYARKYIAQWRARRGQVGHDENWAD